MTFPEAVKNFWKFDGKIMYGCFSLFLNEMIFTIFETIAWYGDLNLSIQTSKSYFIKQMGVIYISTMTGILAFRKFARTFSHLDTMSCIE